MDSVLPLGMLFDLAEIDLGYEPGIQIVESDQTLWPLSDTYCLKAIRPENHNFNVSM